MRLSHIVVATMATFLLTTDAFATTTDVNQAKIAQVASLDGPRLRLLRTHPGGNDFEERGGNSLFKSMRKAGTTIDDYAETLGIASKMKEVERSGRGWSQLQHSSEFRKYVDYLNYLKSKKK
uniref:RXLR-class effector Avh247-like protein n=1 Tax=Phytophthora hibernalis TaxID=175300 RepID=U5Y4Z8_PHYHI|nr:RXLR-class effector Avh247-like protein [Phytophthora hibernalis]